MERIGERLRRRREELGFTIEDIAESTRYRPEIIRGVEEGRAGVFPAEAYKNAFLRAYARKLDLDPAEIVREQKSEEERVREALKGIRFNPSRTGNLRRTLTWLAVFAGVVVGLVILYDRVIKVKGDSLGTGEVDLPGAGAPESTMVGGTDSMAGLPPSDSGETEAEMQDVEVGERDITGGAGREDQPGDLGEKPEEAPAGAAVEPAPEGEEEETSETEPGPQQAGPPGEGAVPRAEPGTETGGEAPPEDLDCLEIKVTGYAVRARIFAGDSLLVSGWLRAGFRDTFCSHEPFWADTIITQGDAMTLVLEGEKVMLPSTRDNVITNFRISP